MSELAPQCRPHGLTAESADVAAEFAQRYPHILKIAVAATHGNLPESGQGCDEQFEFEFALDLLLDGAERLHRLGWESGNRGGIASAAGNAAFGSDSPIARGVDRPTS